MYTYPLYDEALVTFQVKCILVYSILPVQVWTICHSCPRENQTSHQSTKNINQKSSALTHCGHGRAVGGLAAAWDAGVVRTIQDTDRPTILGMCRFLLPIFTYL